MATDVIYAPRPKGRKNKLKLADCGIEAVFLLALYAVAAIHKVRKTIGENIRELRKKAQLSQEMLAEKADLHPVYISQVERGEKAATVETLWKLAKALKIPTSSLLRGV